MSTINIYGQFTYHDDATIIGDHAGLTALRDAINAALDCINDRACRIDVDASDGEGYWLSVICRNDNAQFPSPGYGFYDRVVEESVMREAADRRIERRKTAEIWNSLQTTVVDSEN